MNQTIRLVLLAVAAALLAGCQTWSWWPFGSSGPAAIRIDAASATSYTDSAGNVWLPDQGFEGGRSAQRMASMKIADTKDPAIYRSEKFSMTSFSRAVPNGKYTVKLHFAETAFSEAGKRVFSVNVEGKEIKDLDIFAKVGAERAYIETVNVEVTDGKLDIAFIKVVQNPLINGLEIIPVPTK